MMETEGPRRESYAAVAPAFLLYAAALLFLATKHEMWRDEVRALSIVTTSANLGELFAQLTNEGHPPLWYLALYAGYALFPTPFVLPAMSIVAALLAAAVWLRSAPFSAPIKCLWLAGFYPLFEYSIMARNYGIGMLILFLYLARFPNRFHRPFLSGLLIGLLGNTSAFAWIVAVSLLAQNVIEIIFFRGEERVRPVPVFTSWLTAVLLLAAAGYVMLPDSSSILFTPAAQRLSSILAALPAAIRSHGSEFHNAFSLPFPWGVPVGMVAVYFFCARTPSIALFLFAAVIGTELFHRIFYSALAHRHQGFVFLSVVACLWMNRIALGKNRRTLLESGLGVVLFLQVYMGAKFISEDLRLAGSSAPALGQIVSADPLLRAAVILGEPDFVLETLPYYMPNEIYFGREGKWKRTVSFTSQAKMHFTLSDLLSAAMEAGEATGKPVLILIPPGRPIGAKEELLYGKTFLFDAAGFSALRVSAAHIATLNESFRDENYEVWLLQKRKGSGEKYSGNT